MKKHLLTALFVLCLSAVVALAQGSTSPSSPDQQQPTHHGSGQAGATSNTPDTMGAQTSTPTTDKAKDSSMANVDDESLHRQVHEQLAANPDLQNVQITVKNGVVTLDGTVPNKNDKKEAKKLAKSVPGVKGVREHLTISSSASSASTGATGGVSGTAATTGSAAGETKSEQSGQGVSAQTSTTTGTTSGTTAAAETGQAGVAAGTSAPSASASSSTKPPDQSQSSASATSQIGQTGATAGAAAPSASAMGSGVVQQLQSDLSKQLSGSNIAVSESNNQIVLSGTVASQSDKDKAGEIAQNDAKGMTVVNNITVSGAAGSNPPSGASASGAASTTGGVSGQATGQSNVPSSQEATQPAMGQPAGSTAPSSTTGQSTASEQSATGSQSTSGSMTTAGSDDQLQQQIQTALKNEPTLSNDTINVNITADKIELSGDVSTGKEKHTAKRIAQSYAGNRKVVDRITVKGMGHGANKGDMSNPPSTTDTNKKPPQE